MVNWHDYMAQDAHYQDLLRQAQQDEFSQQMLGRRKRGHPRLARAAAWVGSYMVAWGEALEHYEDAAPSVPSLSTGVQ